jgi:DNA-binding transcriptional MerR regulator
MVSNLLTLKILGSGSKNQYRYYSPMQLTTARMIHVLVRLGVNLQTLQGLSKERTPEKLIKMLAKKERQLADGLNDLKIDYSIIKILHSLLIEGLSAEENEIDVYEMPKARIILGKATNFAGQDDFMNEFLAFCCAVHKPRLNLSYPIGGFWGSMDLFLKHPSEPMHFFSYDPNGHEVITKGLYMVGYTRGYYGQVNDLPQRMEAYAQKNGIVFDGPVYNLYLFDELSLVNTNQYLLQVAASVNETNHINSRHEKRFF